MASSQPGPIREFIETGGEPEYVANLTTYETAPGGNVRGFVWKLIHARYVLQYTFMATAGELVMMGRQAMTVGSEAHNISQWNTDMTEQ